MEVRQTRRRRLPAVLLWVAAPLALLAGLRPWTIRPLDGTRPAVFEAVAFAAATWPKLQREALQTAADVAGIAMPAGASATKSRFLKGTGVVSSVDRRSRVGIMRIQVTGSTPAAVAMQIGPVIRGTALRDAAGFIQFSDFTNQFDYAGAASALNDHSLRTVVAPLPIDTLQGRTLTFIGAVAGSAVRDDGAIEMVPVQLQIVGAPAK